MAAARNKTRAARRIAERTKANAAAVEAGIAVAEESKRPKLKNARYKTQLEVLASRGNITLTHLQAGARLASDYEASMTLPVNLTDRYEPNTPRPPRQYQFPADAPNSIAARERYDRAMQAVGPFLNGILLHVAVCDLPPKAWGPLNGRAVTHGVPVLFTALDALSAHYAERRMAA